jgi:hypothetical protein
MPYSAYFAERAGHYRKLAIREPNGWQAECQLALANLFLEMSCDMRLRELTVSQQCRNRPAGFRVPCAVRLLYRRRQLRSVGETR